MLQGCAGPVCIFWVPYHVVCADPVCEDSLCCLCSLWFVVFFALFLFFFFFFLFGCGEIRWIVSYCLDCSYWCFYFFTFLHFEVCPMNRVYVVALVGEQV